MAIITISRQFGSNGDEIAGATAARLGHTLVDKQTVEEKLHQYGVNDSALSRYDEKRPGFWAGLSADQGRYAQYLRLAVLDVALTGGAVILGRGAHSILSEIPGIVTVRVVAPQDVRHARIVEHFGASDDQADRMIQDSDRERDGFHRYFYGANWNAPDQYSLTINTGFVPVATAVDLIATIHNQIESEAENTRTRELINERWIATRVTADIRFGADLPVRYLNVQVSGSKVTLYGAVSSSAISGRCEEIARNVPGVEAVECDLQEIPDYSPTLM